MAALGIVGLGALVVIVLLVVAALLFGGRVLIALFAVLILAGAAALLWLSASSRAPVKPAPVRQQTWDGTSSAPEKARLERVLKETVESPSPETETQPAKADAEKTKKESPK